MHTTTAFYLDADLESLVLATTRMEEAGWSVRQSVMLEPVTTIKRYKGGVGSPQIRAKKLSMMVVYERSLHE